MHSRFEGSGIKKWVFLSGTEFFPSENLKEISFEKLVHMEYNLSELQRIRFVLFQVDKFSKIKYLKKEWKGKPKFGKVITSASEIISKKGFLEKELM